MFYKLKTLAIAVKRCCIITAVTIFCLSMTALTQAQPGSALKPAHPGGSATNPVAPIPQLQIQNQFIPDTYDSSGYSNVFLIQPVAPYELFGKPMISRLTLPVITTPDPDGPINDTTDLGDLTTINFAMWDIKNDSWGGDIGFGPALVLPTGADDRTGSGKWQAGPNFIYINTANQKFEWGFLAYQVWSFSGDSTRESVSQLNYQPIFTWHLSNGWYLSTGDHTWSYDWKTDKWDIPIMFGPGRTFKIGGQTVSAYVNPYYNVGDNVGDEYGVKASMAILF